jgi:putative MFS transporter
MSETMSSTSAGNSLDSPELAGFRWYVAALSAMGVFLDGFDLTVIAAVGLLIQERFRYSGNIVGLVDASAFIGMVIGSLAIGWVTDRIGRRKMYFIDLVGFVVFATLTAAAQSTWQLVAARILLGVCIGADYAISTTLTAEFGGKTDRGRLIVGLTVAGSVAVVVVYVLAIILIPTGPSSWRWMLLVGAVIALVSAFLRRRIPESPRWLIRQGRTEEAARILREITGKELTASTEPEAPPRIPWTALFSPRLFKWTFFVCAFWFLFGVAYYGIALFSPQIVSAIAGTSLRLTYVGSALIALFSLAGTVIGAVLVERIGRRTNLILGFTIMLIPLLILALSGGKAALWAVVILVGITLLAAQIGPGGLSLVYPAELFPTDIRASAVGLGTAVSRIGSILGVLLFPHLITDWGLDKALWMFVAVGVLGVLVSVTMAPETRGRTLEELSGGDLPAL